MTVTVKLITEQTTNQLAVSVNRAQADGWFPVCGIVWFNARYTQLMALDTNGTEVPKCNYFIVDSEDGIDFAQRVNRHLIDNVGASCLSSVQYVNARYIQAWGDDTLHHGGGGNIPAALKWYSEAQLAGRTVPTILTDEQLPYVTIDGTNIDMAALAFVTDYGTGVSDMTIPLTITASSAGGSPSWQVVGDLEHTGKVEATDGAMVVAAGGGTGQAPRLTLLSGISGTTKMASLEAGATSLMLCHDAASLLAIADSQPFVLQSGSDPVLSVNDTAVILSHPQYSATNSVDLRANTMYLRYPGSALYEYASNNQYTQLRWGFENVLSLQKALQSSWNMPNTGLKVTTGATGDYTAYEFTNTTFNINAGTTSAIALNPTSSRYSHMRTSLQMSDTGGSLGYNNYLRMAWDTNGWNVSQNTFVAFSSRATYSLMMGPNDSRVEANATGVLLNSNLYSATATTLNLDGDGARIARASVERFKVDEEITAIKAGTAEVSVSTLDNAAFVGINGKPAFFADTNITALVQGNAEHGVVINNVGEILYKSAANELHRFNGGHVVPDSDTQQLGTALNPWYKIYTGMSTPWTTQDNVGSAVIPVAVAAKMAQLIPKMMNGSQGDFTIGYTYDDIIAVFGATDAAIYGLAATVNGVKTVNPAAIAAMIDQFRRNNGTREAQIQAQEKICGLVPQAGLNANHALSDSGYSLRITGKANGDFDMYLVDATPGRNFAYQYRKQTGTATFEMNASSSAVSTAAFKLNTTDVNSTGDVDVRVYVSDITTGRAWQVRIWPQSRTTRRYNMSIVEATEATPVYTDYSL